MKVRITFELDLKDTHYNINKVKFIPICLENLVGWFYKLHTHYLNQKFDDLFTTTAPDCTYNDAMKKAIMDNVEQDLTLSKQLFNNYKIEGVTDDGHTFEVSRNDSGFIEGILVNGVKTYIEPCDDDDED